eukprot:c10581_g1_i1.p1 GENE.c10581_g1_i1~~c10581_g1_i1.p1  ORF type:complete len:182 (-),score=47.69 c10581_g1_i1:246-767(-)
MFSALRSAKVVVVASRSLHTLSHELQPSKILCIGRNYIDHVKELNNAIPAEPVIFMKPPSALLANGKNILLPHFSSDVHHEAELVVMVGTKTTPRDAPSEADALNIVYGYAAGLDMTARDVQNKLKAQGLPWTVINPHNQSTHQSINALTETIFKKPRTHTHNNNIKITNSQI